MSSERFSVIGAGEKLTDIDVTEDEIKKISRALKDEGFCKLLGEYVDEIRDPENRKRYEEEIAQLEQERGNDITWIHPQPGHVLKLRTAGGGKAFINVCSSQHVGAPSCSRGSGGQQRGLNWSIPYAQSRPREDRDKASAACTVYDVVFHPDTLYMASKNLQMRQLVEQTAVGAVDDTFKAGLKKEKITYPKLAYKGVPQASVIRRRRPGAGGAEPLLPPAVEEQLRQQAADLTLSPDRGASDGGQPTSGTDNTPVDCSQDAPAPVATSSTESRPADSRFETPKYTVVYRNSVDMQQFAARCGGRASRPQALVVRIQLPRLSSAAGLDLDVGVRTLKLRSPAGYRLDTVLPLPVLDAAGSAQFDRAARCLVVTLPVAPAAECVPDSGIDSDGAKNESDDDAYRTAGTDSVEAEGEGGSEVCESSPVAEEDEEAVMSCESVESVVTAARLYSLPRFALQQDADRLLISLLEPSLVSDSVCVVCSGRSLTVTATSLGAGLTPLYYRLHLALPAAVADPTVRCDQHGITLTAEKAGSGADWAGCQVGSDEIQMTEQLIPCQASCEESQMMEQLIPGETSCEKSQMTEQLISLQCDEPDSTAAAGPPSDEEPQRSPLTPGRHDSGAARPRGSASSSSLGSVTSYDGPLSVSSQSSVDESLQKKGILKKRHCSESSADELLMSPSSSSLAAGSLMTYDEAEEATVKKSVSFSSHVVEKRYRTNSTILHDAARTERQRAKKKRQRAARRHSEGDTSETDEFRPQLIEDCAALAPQPQPVARRNSSDGDTSENDEFQSSAADGSTGAGRMSQSRKEKKRKNKRKQDRKQKDLLNNELMFDLDM